MSSKQEIETNQNTENKISGAIELQEIAEILENGPRETTKCCATGTCD
jgi:hypothetical protein